MRRHPDLTDAQAAMFSLAKEMASALLPGYYDGTQLAASELDVVRGVVREVIEDAFGKVVAQTKAVHDCQECETGFRVSTLYPAVEICMGEFSRLWKDRLATN